MEHSILIAHKQKEFKKPIILGPLMLTSLIDAFAILLFYLLINFGNPYSIQEQIDSVNLPMAHVTEPSTQGITFTAKDGHYYLNKEEIKLSKAPDRIKELIKQYPKPSLIIEADRHSQFSIMSPIIKAAAAAGLTSYKFAIFDRGAMTNARGVKP